MKNSLHTLKHITSLLTLTTILTLKAHTMDDTQLDITGVDRHELIKALYEHTTGQDTTKRSTQTTTAHTSSMVSSFFLRVTANTEIISVKRWRYSIALMNFSTEYQLDLHNKTHPNHIYVAEFDAAYGIGTAKSIYDQLAADADRLNAATKLLASLQKEAENSILTPQVKKKEGDEDDMETIHFNPILHTKDEK